MKGGRLEPVHFNQIRKEMENEEKEEEDKNQEKKEQKTENGQEEKKNLKLKIVFS